jgi:phosphoglycerate dehydrogenase-like enzyme
MSEFNSDIRCLIMSDFVEELFSEYGIPVKIEHGGWLTGRVPFTPEQMIERVNHSQTNLVIIEVDEVSRKVMEACPSLQVIASLRANPMNVDLSAANDHGIVVLHTPGRNSNAVAEFTLCLILNLLRHTSAAHNDLIDGRWGEKEEDPYLRFRGSELQGKTVGILGLGEIGQAVAHLLSGFDVKILAHDPFQSNEIFLKAQASPVDLNTLFSTSDIITLHAPLNNQTKSIVSDDLIRRLRPGAILINTARANLVEKNALVSALKDGRIAAAGLDVHYEEPPFPDDPLLSLQNVLCTPHIGGATREVITKGSRMVILDLFRLLNGEKPIHAAVYPQANLRIKAAQ